MGQPQPAARSATPASPRLASVPRGLPSRPPAPQGRTPGLSRPPLPWRALLLWPLVLTAAITLLRLLGELRGWPAAHFSRLPGGGLATVGITWLVPIVGFYAGWRLARAGHRPADAARAGWQPLAALATGWLLAAVAGRLADAGWTANLLAWAVASLAVTAAALLAWPAAGSALLAYAAASRALVTLVMAVAMARGWGTHYDAVPPGFPDMARLPRFLLLALLPQMTIWVAFTVAVGVACAALGRAAAARRL
jgi:hypothetical protein